MEKLAGPQIDAERDPLDSLGVAQAELDDLRDQRDRKIVDAKKTAVFQRADRHAFPRARKPGHHDDVEAVRHSWELSAISSQL